MNERNDERTRKLLREAMPPVEDRRLKRDLWPQMLRRLDQQPLQVPWFDWALLALLAVWVFVFPKVIPALLYQL